MLREWGTRRRMKGLGFKGVGREGNVRPSPSPLVIFIFILCDNIYLKYFYI